MMPSDSKEVPAYLVKETNPENSLNELFRTAGNNSPASVYCNISMIKMQYIYGLNSLCQRVSPRFPSSGQFDYECIHDTPIFDMQEHSFDRPTNNQADRAADNPSEPVRPVGH